MPPTRPTRAASGSASAIRHVSGWAANTRSRQTELAVLLLAPLVVPRIAPVVGRMAGRPLAATLPARAVVHAIVGNAIAWLLYGAAFQLFAEGILGSSTGNYPEYLAAYTISYLAGYLALFAPAGAGVRDRLSGRSTARCSPATTAS